MSVRDKGTKLKGPKNAAPCNVDAPAQTTGAGAYIDGTRYDAAAILNWDPRAARLPAILEEVVVCKETGLFRFSASCNVAKI